MRKTANIRRLAAETTLTVDDLILPIFISNGKGIKKPIESMPGIYLFSPDIVAEAVQSAVDKGIAAVLLFGTPETKDENGSTAEDPEGVVQEACREICASSKVMIITDVCLCQYTDHGHCGVLDNQHRIDNASTLVRLAAVALSHAEAGADMIAPSAMMDGQVAAIRAALDEAGYTETGIMSYSAKYSSAYYGPFRDAVSSSPAKGDRRSHQMAVEQSDEAMREMEADISEGADWLMVKPALAYLDIIRRANDYFNHPIAAYNVSGEYSMIKAAVAKGWLDERRAVMENLIAMKRAGARAIITYHAEQVAKWIQEG